MKKLNDERLARVIGGKENLVLSAYTKNLQSSAMVFVQTDATI